MVFCYTQCNPGLSQNSWHTDRYSCVFLCFSELVWWWLSSWRIALSVRSSSNNVLQLLRFSTWLHRSAVRVSRHFCIYIFRMTFNINSSLLIKIVKMILFQESVSAWLRPSVRGWECCIGTVLDLLLHLCRRTGVRYCFSFIFFNDFLSQ